MLWTRIVFTPLVRVFLLPRLTSWFSVGSDALSRIRVHFRLCTMEFRCRGFSGALIL